MILGNFLAKVFLVGCLNNMYMSFSPPTIIFFLSILLGSVLGLIWDLNRVLKNNVHKNKKKFAFFLDILFCITAAVSTICFFYFYTYSGFRFFILIGLLIGFVLFYCTIEKAVYFILNLIFEFIFKILRFLKKIIESIADILENIIIKIKNTFYHKIYIKICLKIKKIKNKKKSYKNSSDEYLIKNILKKLNKYIKKNKL